MTLVAQPRAETIPSQHLQGEGMHDHAPLTFAERASELHLMLGEGQVPSIAEYLEMQDIASQITQKPVFDYEQSVAPVSTAYFGPDGERISADLALGLWADSRPGRWFQAPENEHLLSEAAQMMRHPDGNPQVTTRLKDKELQNYHQKMEERFAAMIPAVKALTGEFAPFREATAAEKSRMPGVKHDQEVLIRDTDAIKPEMLERMVALSRFSRKELEAQGVDVARLAKEKTKVKATAPSVKVTFVDRESELLRPRKEMFVEAGTDDTQVLPQNGAMRARATVFDRETGRAVRREVGETMPTDDAEVLAQLLRDNRITSDGRIVAGALYPEKMARGSHVEKKPPLVLFKKGFETRKERSDYLRATGGGLSNLSVDERRRVDHFKQQLASLESLEAPVALGGKVPSREAIVSALFPEQVSPISPQQESAVQTALAKLQYVSIQAQKEIANRAAKVDRFAPLHHTRQDVEQWLRSAGQSAATLAEQAKPQAVIAARKLGAAALSMLVAAAFLPVRGAESTEPIAKPPAAVSAYRGTGTNRRIAPIV